ncbi:unnamed protein product, partial [marine sediment metagenome]
PFYIVERSDRELVLSRNRLYWDTRNVKLDKIRVLFIENAAEITEAFNQGKIHWANNWETSLLIDRTKIVFNPLFATSYFFFVCEHPPWNDERVRRALALMLPWEEIRSESVIFATSRLIPPIPGYPEIEGLSKTNLDEALSLLQEAGYPQGRELPPIIIKVPEDSESERIAGVMAETWEKNIKLYVNILPYPYDRYLEEVKKTDYMLGSVIWIGDYADPLTFLQMWTGESNLNDARFSDHEFDRLIDESFSKEGVSRYEQLGMAE